MRIPSTMAALIRNVGCLCVILLDVHWLISITAYAQRIPEDCSACGIGLKNGGGRPRGDSSTRNATGYPWVVSIGFDYSTHDCLGSVIDAFHILTAAHCVIDIDGYSGYHKKVYFRNHPRISRSNASSIDKIIIHPLYGLIESESTDVVIAKYDIALVKLKQRIKCDEDINPICLPYADLKLPLGARTILTAWGLPDPGTRRRSDRIRHGFLKNLNFSDCIKGVPETRMIKNHMLCQGGTQHSMCYGDSGGPLMYKINQKYFIVGIASSETNTNCALNKPMTFTEVVKFLNWIQNGKKITTFSFPRGRQQNPIWEERWMAL